MSEHGPVVSTWFARGTYPTCTCGLDPRDNAVLTAHWTENGIRVYDDHGRLVVEPIMTEQCNGVSAHGPHDGCPGLLAHPATMIGRQRR